MKKAEYVQITMEYTSDYDVTELDVREDLKKLLKINEYKKIIKIELIKNENNERVDGTVAHIQIER